MTLIFIMIVNHSSVCLIYGNTVN